LAPEQVRFSTRNYAPPENIRDSPLRHDAGNASTRATGREPDQPVHGTVGDRSRLPITQRSDSKGLPRQGLRRSSNEAQWSAANGSFIPPRHMSLGPASQNHGLLPTAPLASYRSARHAALSSRSENETCCCVCAGVLLVGSEALRGRRGGARPFKRPSSISGRRRQAAVSRLWQTHSRK